ncbi:MAG: hypothetical protein WBM90_06995 [Acidimicrobiia bacterium]
MRKPLTGAILGIVLGLAVAVILQQQGIWPLDQLTVFFMPAVLGFLGLLILSIGKEGSTVTFVIALIILIPMAVWGALGFGDVNEVGVLNGGCKVEAMTSVPDATNVTDTSKQDPFQIDPDGGLIWAATSPVVFMDYPWKIWVEIGGVQITLDSEESQNNDGGSEINGGDVPNVTAYAEARGIDISQLRGVYKVGGSAANTCDGFGFVTLIADPFETLASQIAAGIALLAIILFIIIMIVSRRSATAAAGAAVGAASASAIGTTNGDVNVGNVVPGDVDGDGDVDFDDLDGMTDQNGSNGIDPD